MAAANSEGKKSAAAAKAAASADTAADKKAAAAAAAAGAGKATDSKGKELMKAAEGKLAEWTWFSGTTKKEEAMEMFDKAAAQFKLAKEWEAAAAAYIRAAETCDQYLKAENESCNYYLQAAKAYKNAGSKEAAKMFKMVVALHMENNRFSTAAKIYKEIAEIEEKENNIPAAMQAWEQAADCHFAEDQQTNGNQCLLKIAHYAALREDYKKAIEIYEKVANASLANNLLQYAAKEYMFKALLCQFVLASRAGDIQIVSDSSEKYKTLSAQWDGCREQKLIESLTKAYDAGDTTKFTDALFTFDRISKLDSWTSTLLLNVKRQLQAATTTTSAAAVAFATTPSAAPAGGAAGAGAGAKAAGAEPDLQGGKGAPAAAPPIDEPDMM